ncbi:Reticulon - like 2 [Theobroma cacao]|nr:Reticulon - like 2 [Theobroma cacao]
MEEKETERNCPPRFNSNMGIAGSLSAQFYHCCFMVGHVHRCFTVPLGKCTKAPWQCALPCGVREPPNLSDLELSKETALEIENTCRTFIEEVIGWMFHVTVEGNWLVFARTVVGLLLLSYVGSDLLTLLYIGIKTAMTVPLIYVKYGDQIKRCGERVKDQFRRLYEMFDEKVIRKMKSKIVREENKEKKVE